MSRRISSPVFVGREPELERVRAILGEVRAGGGRTLLVGGESGVGKTRFVREFARLPEAAGFRVLTGRCLGSSGSLPYAPFREAFRSLPELAPGAELAPVVGTEGDGGLDLPNGMGEAAEPASAGLPGEVSRLFELVLRLIQRLAANEPLILVVEDLHWAQASTHDLFAFLAQNPSDAPVLLVGTFRSDLGRSHRLWPVLAELDRDTTIDRLELPRLSRDEVAALVESIRSEPASADLVGALADRTSGNPFFVEEMLAANADPTGPLPESLREALRQRVLGVSESAQASLRVAAVAGLRVDERVIGAMTGRADTELWESLRELVDANLLVPDEARDRPVYAFRHALVREAVDDDLLPGERIRLHSRIAEFLSSTRDAAIGGAPSAASDIADHWEAGRDLARALPSHLDAARAARRLFAFAEAGRHLDRAVSLWDRVPEADRPPGELRSTILAEAAEAATLSGRQQRAIELVRLALDEIDRDAEPVEAARLLERLGQYLWETGDDRAGQAARAEALALLPAGHSTDRARMLAALAAALVVGGRHDDARPIAAQALESATAAGALAEEGSVRNTLGVLAAAEGDIDSAVAELLEARAIAVRVGNPYERVRAYANHAAILGNAGRLAEALAVAQEGAEVARQVGLHRPYGRFLVTNAVVALFGLGQWSEAEAIAMDALAETSSGVLAAHLNLVSAQLFVAQGAFRQAGDHLDAAEALAARSEDPSLIATLAGTRSELAMWIGDPDGAWASVARAFERLPSAALAPELAPIAARAAADRAERARTKRHVADLDQIRADLEAILARYRAAGDKDPVVARALLAADAEATRLDGDADPVRFAAAAEAYADAGQPYPAAYLRYRQAEAILTHTRVRTEAVEILEPARRTAIELGARPLVDEIDGLARRARLELADEAAPAPAETPDAQATAIAGLGLTERELEVLGLIASGMTNRQIAEVLFISPKTAGAHVSNIIGKLGVSGRVEAATIAERMGLTATPAGDA